MFPRLEQAVDEVEIPVDGPALLAALALWDRLGAKIAEAAGAFDAASLWDLDAATSMTAWLRSEAGMSRRDSARLAATAHKLRQLPVTAAAWRAGELSGGQVDAVLANVGNHLERFADHEAAVVDTLTPLAVHHVARVMAAWRAKAEALAEDVEDAERERSVHLSTTLGGRFELSGSLDAATGAVVATALRVASSDDSDAEPARTPAERRADALGDVCRFFLDHQRGWTGGRHRPHLNVIVDVAALTDGLGGETPDGTPLDRSPSRPCCATPPCTGW